MVIADFFLLLTISLASDHLECKHKSTVIQARRLCKESCGKEILKSSPKCIYQTSCYTLAVQVTL